MGWRTMRLVEPDAIDLVRSYARGEMTDADQARLAAEGGIFLPVEVVTASGRARCRRCGEPIPKGSDTLSFQLDLYLRKFGLWGHAVTAYACWPECADQKEGTDG